MTYELAAGERGTFSIGGRWAGPIKCGVGVLLGVFMAAVIGLAGRNETRYLEPANDYFPFAVSVLLVIALIPPIAFWSFLEKECIHLILDGDKRRITLWFQGLAGTWSEDLGFDKASYFEVVDIRAGSSRSSHLRLDLTEGVPIVVAKFRMREDADREKHEAAAVLDYVSTSRKGDEPPRSIIPTDSV